MKRLIILFGIALILIGIRFHHTDGSIHEIIGGNLTTYSSNTYRIDFLSDNDIDIYDLLEKLNAKVVLTEKDGNILYAYSPLIYKSVYLHKKRVNVMVYLDENKIVIGVPIIKGSY